jgi:hypothetical protein
VGDGRVGDALDGAENQEDDRGQENLQGDPDR